MEIENTDKVQNLSTEESESTIETDGKNLVKNVDWLDVKRGCCGTLLVLLLITGCLVINMVTNF